MPVSPATVVWPYRRRWTISLSTYLTKLGVPDRNYNLTGQLDFDITSFHRTAPTRRFLLIPSACHRSLTVARPSGIWLVTDFGVTYERPPE